MDIKMIVTDLDHTLLRRDKTVSDYTAGVLKRAQEHGILLAFATARDFRFVTEHISPLTGITPDIIIADNGALAQQNGIDLYKKMIPYADVSALMPCFDIVRCVSTEEVYYISGRQPNDHWSVGKKATTDCISTVKSDAFFIAGNVSGQFLPQIEHYNIRAVTYSDVDLVTVVHREATKLNALTAVANTLNINLDNIMAFGDDYSDIEMLSRCGHGVAVANAIAECKAAAKHICDANENDGMAKWVEEFLAAEFI